MLKLPEALMTHRSVNRHNISVISLADWIEADILFADDELSLSDVADSLCENNVYRDQDFAKEGVHLAWAQLRTRSQHMGEGSPFQVNGNMIHRRIEQWQDSVALAFLLVLAIAQIYKSWSTNIGTNYIEQGSLFERVTSASLSAQGWRVYHTGWASGIQTLDFKSIVARVADCLQESTVNEAMLQLYSSANEKGLDLVCYMPFVDQRPGFPVYLMQCASGGDWGSKKYTPEINVWNRLITFSTAPRRGFAMPFALDREEFLMTCHAVDGLVLERYRILEPSRKNKTWIPDDLKASLIAWLTPRIATLPLDDV